MKHRLSLEDEQSMCAMYRAGDNIIEIVRSFGVDRKTLSNVRRRQNEPRRPMIKLSGPAHWNYKGGRSISGPYIRVLLPSNSVYSSMTDVNGYVAEHRLIVAQNIGRCLTDEETVHHIDGNKHNNAIDNLQLRAHNHGSGQVRVCLSCGSHNIGSKEV